MPFLSETATGRPTFYKDDLSPFLLRQSHYGIIFFNTDKEGAFNRIILSYLSYVVSENEQLNILSCVCSPQISNIGLIRCRRILALNFSPTLE
jgi:hypothetical protein